MHVTRYKPLDTRVHRALGGSSRVQMLRVLREQARAMTVAEVAEQVGLHPNTVRQHLDHLVDVQLATREQERLGRPGRPHRVYAATPPESGPEGLGGGDSYRLLAGVLARHFEEVLPEPTAAAAAVGRAWGRRLTPATQQAERPDARQATGHVVQLLDGLGFSPRSDDTGQTIELHRCPFLQIAEEHPTAVCGVHLGLMQGAFTQLNSPVQVSRLDPFVAPGLCLAHLRPVPSQPERKPS